MKISEAAKLLGISTDTIRYYEKEGVIYPKRISQNNYRDLDNKDVISLLACLYNRKIGYSMKESVEYVEGIPVSKVTDILNNKICELESEVKETKNLIDYLTTLKVESETDFIILGTIGSLLNLNVIYYLMRKFLNQNFVLLKIIQDIMQNYLNISHSLVKHK